MTRSGTILTALALGAMLATGSATASMARGGDGGGGGGHRAGFSAGNSSGGIGRGMSHDRAAGGFRRHYDRGFHRWIGNDYCAWPYSNYRYPYCP